MDSDPPTFRSSFYAQGAHPMGMQNRHLSLKSSGWVAGHDRRRGRFPYDEGRVGDLGLGALRNPERQVP
jgi:hypothetical protein